MSSNTLASSRRRGLDLVLETEVDDAMLSCAVEACIRFYTHGASVAIAVLANCAHPSHFDIHRSLLRPYLSCRQRMGLLSVRT